MSLKGQSTEGMSLGLAAKVQRVTGNPYDPAAIGRGMQNLALEHQFRRERAKEVEAQRRERQIRAGLDQLSRDYFGGVL